MFKIFVQTSFSKKKLIKEKIFNKNKIIFLEDPIIRFKKNKSIKKRTNRKIFSKKEHFL
jgi:hypothetical protein